MFALMTKKRKRMAPGLAQPFSIGTVSEADLLAIEQELQACESPFFNCTSSIRVQAADDLVVAIADAKNKIVAFAMPLENGWSPSIVWVAPAFERQGFGSLMSALCDKLAALNEEVLMQVQDLIHTEGFWEKQGYVSGDDLEIIGRQPDEMYKVLLKVDLSEDDECQGLLENHREFVSKRAAPQLDLSWPNPWFEMRVGVFVSVFTDDGSLSDGVFSMATLDQGYLTFQNTMCIPLKKAQVSNRTLAIHIIFPDQLEPVLKVAIPLSHLMQAAFVGDAVLFNRVKVPERNEMSEQPFPGVSDVHVNTLARSLIGRFGVVDLRNSKTDLVQLIANHANKPGPWKVQISL